MTPLIEFFDGQMDMFEKITSFIDGDALFAFSLSCRAARDAVLSVQCFLKTSYKSVVVKSISLFEWAVSMGADTKKLDVAASHFSTDIKLLNHLFFMGYHLIDICNANARAGNLEVVRWACKNGFHYDALTCALAAESGHLNVLEWLRMISDCPWDRRTTWVAARNGHLPVLQWVLSNGGEYDNGTIARAAFGGHIHIMKWLREKGYSWDKVTCSFAASGGQLDALKWAINNGCLWDEDTCLAAANSGFLEILKWARANDCPWDARICVFAARKGHQHIIEWALDNGVPWEGH